MKTVKVWIATRKVGSQCETSFEIEDDATDKEIEEIAQECVWEMAEWNWEIVE